MKGKISEIFESVQGEGIYLGEKQIFVRLFGCNLECKYCDTKRKDFIELNPEELLKKLNSFDKEYHSISYTGGEPLLQKDFLKESMRLTRNACYKNYLETNGTLAEELLEIINFVDVIAMDIKLPSSTGLEDFWKRHNLFLKVASSKETFLKVVVCESTEEEDLRQCLRLIQEINRSAILVLQPNILELGPSLEKKLIGLKHICTSHGVTACVIPQIHKIVGVR